MDMLVVQLDNGILLTSARGKGFGGVDVDDWVLGLIALSPSNAGANELARAFVDMAAFDAAVKAAGTGDLEALVEIATPGNQSLNFSEVLPGESTPGVDDPRVYVKDP